MMIIDTIYNIGDMVYMITDQNGYPRLITAITIRHNNYVEYELTLADMAVWCTELEITSQPPLPI